MKISAKAEYACLAIIELAKSGSNGGTRRVREIAEAQEIPERYLVQILLQLKAAGMVQSARGSEGGYHLVRSPDSLTIADIIAAIDGPSEPTPRGLSGESRLLGDVLRRAHEAERQILTSATVAELSAPTGPLDWVV